MSLRAFGRARVPYLPFNFLLFDLSNPTQTPQLEKQTGSDEMPDMASNTTLASAGQEDVRNMIIAPDSFNHVVVSSQG